MVSGMSCIKRGVLANSKAAQSGGASLILVDSVQIVDNTPMRTSNGLYAKLQGFKT